MNSGGIPYKIPFALAAVNAITDLLWIGAALTAGARSLVGIVGVEVFNETDETSQQLLLRFFRTVTDNSAQGTAVTPKKTLFGHPAARLTARAGISGANLSAETDLWLPIGGNALSGWSWAAKHDRDILWLSPDSISGEAARAALKVVAAPSPALNLSGYVDVIEFHL